MPLVFIGSDGSIMEALTSYGRPFHQCGTQMTVGPTRSFPTRELADPVSPLVASAQLSLAAEFPDQAQARAVLAAIGSGERSFTNIARAGGGIAHPTLTRATDLLIKKGLVAGDLPISLAPSKERRYRITDTYLRFWLAFRYRWRRPGTPSPGSCSSSARLRGWKPRRSTTTISSNCSATETGRPVQ